MRYHKYLRQKYWELKHPRLTVISIVVVIFGGIMLYTGIIMIFGETVEKLNSDLEKAKETTRVYNVGEPLTFDITSEYDTINDMPAKSILLTISKDIIFARDTVNITAKAISVDNSVSRIALILNDGSISFKIKTPLKEIDFEREYAEKHNLLLELNRETNPPFVDEIQPRFNKPDQTYYVTGAIQYNNGTVRVFPNSDGLFTIYSKINKLQADTNKVILEQSDRTEINNIQQEITNQVFLGLTVIGIAVIPLVGGFDVLLRIHFDKKHNSHKQEKPIDKIEPWNCDWFHNSD